MLSKEQEALLRQLESQLNPQQCAYLSGYFQARAGSVADAGPSAGSVKILFATETGNAKQVSQQLAKQIKQAGFKVSSAPVNRIKIEELAKEEGQVIFVSATHGEGDPPEGAVGFFQRLKEAKDGLLPKLEYAVLALGDSSYKQYCEAGREIDRQMQRLGAKPICERRELDVDYVEHIPGWIEQVMKALPRAEGASAAFSFAMPDADVPHSGKGYSRLDPVVGTIKEIVNLNDQGSNKETYHIEIEYSDPLQYAPGDAAGIVIPAVNGEEPPVPRLYSIASSPALHGNEVHLTVALARHTLPDGTQGFGVCSHYLAGLKEGDEVQFYIHQNHLFRLPPDDRDIIMIGPGTGIAPFRSFVYERNERGAGGRNWLFFGEQHAHCDFLYQQEWIDLHALGAVEIGLAFSRDQDHKIYVQDRIREQADAVYEWLENGAHLYVCGTKDPMSRDVENTLLEIIAARGGKNPEAARDYLEGLAEEGRYVKDVY